MGHQVPTPSQVLNLTWELSDLLSHSIQYAQKHPLSDRMYVWDQTEAGTEAKSEFHEDVAQMLMDSASAT